MLKCLPSHTVTNTIERIPTACETKSVIKKVILFEEESAIETYPLLLSSYSPSGYEGEGSTLFSISILSVKPILI